jgi:hypothetical protein
VQIDLLVLALLSAFWPTLVVVDVLAFQTANPERILLAFLAGGLLTTVTVGTLIVVAFEGTSFGSSSQTSSTDAVLDFVIAGLAFLCAFIISRLPDRPKKPPGPRQQRRSELTEKAIERGAPLAFVGGILLNIVPGLFPLIALKDLMELDYSWPEVVATLFAFYVVMFAFIEAPIVAYVFARDWTGKEVTRFNDWLTANHRRVGAWVLCAGGTYMTIRGIVAAVT